MIQLRGQVRDRQIQQRNLPSVFRLEFDEWSGVLQFQNDRNDVSPIKFLIEGSGPQRDDVHDFVLLSADFGYLKRGDIVEFQSNFERINVHYRGPGAVNSLLLTERCDNFCIMCSQPPRDKEDSERIDVALAVLELIDDVSPAIGLTGGEPTLYGPKFLQLVENFFEIHEHGSLHILSNGKRFADKEFAAGYSKVATGDAMVGIPLYGPEENLHDFIVQSKGAFELTVQGIINLAAVGSAVEIRVVLQKHNVEYLDDLCRFITRNLPFVDHVALMGLEIMGLARSNLSEVWVDPLDYAQTLSRSVLHLAAHKVNVSIYNHQLCLLPREIREFAVQSISEWKNEFDPVCFRCDLAGSCCGFFTSARYASSRGIRPLNLDGDFLDTDDDRLLPDARQSKVRTAWSRRSIPLGHDFGPLPDL